jgi:hypothetical protein
MEMTKNNKYQTITNPQAKDKLNHISIHLYEVN